MKRKKVYNTELMLSYIKSNKLTKYKFCKLANISMSSLDNILNQNMYITLKPILKICKLLKIELKDIFKV